MSIRDKSGQGMNPAGSPDNGTGMGVIVQTVTRWLKGPILLFGIYIVLYGHITPGGGFGGGVIIACAFILITLAMGEKSSLSLFSKGAASRLDSAGLLLFLFLGWLGTWAALGFYFGNLAVTPEQDYFTLLSGGSIPVLNIALGLKVASALFLVFTVLTALRITAPGMNSGLSSGLDSGADEDADKGATEGEP